MVSARTRSSTPIFRKVARPRGAVCPRRNDGDSKVTKMLCGGCQSAAALRAGIQLIVYHRYTFASG